MFSSHSRLSEIFQQTALLLTHGWVSPTAPKVKMWFILGEDFLAYAGEVEGAPQEDSKNPLVVSQGLRSCDCLELYLCEPNTSRYQEFNLGPDGKWWTCAFSDIRVREIEQPLSDKAETYAEILPFAWRAAFRLPLSELLIDFDPQQVRYNLSAIVGPPHAQSFPSFADIKVQEPDFHQPKYFRTTRFAG